MEGMDMEVQDTGVVLYRDDGLAGTQKTTKKGISMTGDSIKGLSTQLWGKATRRMHSLYSPYVSKISTM